MEKENVSGLSMLVECEECGNKFGISQAGGVTHKKEYVVNGRSIYLTFYDCPSCGRRHVTQIDDVSTVGLLKKYSRMFASLAKKNLNSQPIAEKQLAKFKKQSQHLRNRRFELMKEFTGAVACDPVTGEEITVRFSV